MSLKRSSIGGPCANIDAGEQPDFFAASGRRSARLPATIWPMQPFKLPTRLLAPAIAAALLAICACTPTFDWRDTRAENGAFVVLMPTKPTVFTKPVLLNGQQFPMTMTAAEVQQVMFAVGSLNVPDAAMAEATLKAMKDALLKNIGASDSKEKTTVSTADHSITIEVSATGAPDAKGQPRVLFAHFVAKDTLLVQALVAGPQKAVNAELVDTFLTSLKVH